MHNRHFLPTHIWTTAPCAEIRWFNVQSFVSACFQTVYPCSESKVKAECQLFKAAEASSAAPVCERKRLGVANNGIKVTSGGARWWGFYSSKDRGIPVIASEQIQVVSVCTVSWGAKVSSPLTVKTSKAYLGKISGINWIPLTGKPINCSGKRLDVFAAKNLTLLDPSNTKMVSYWAMRTTASADGVIISKSFFN